MLSGEQRRSDTNNDTNGFWLGGYTDNNDHQLTQITETHPNNYDNSEYNLHTRQTVVFYLLH